MPNAATGERDGLAEEGYGDHQICCKACSRADSTARRTNLESEVLGLIPTKVCVGGAEAGDEDDDSGDDQAEIFLGIVVAIKEDVSCGLAHEVESDETPSETDDHDGTESHQQPTATDPVNHDHATKKEESFGDGGDQTANRRVGKAQESEQRASVVEKGVVSGELTKNLDKADGEN